MIVFSSIITIIGQPLTPFGDNLNVGVMISEYLLVGYYRKYKVKVNNFALIIVAILFYLAEYMTVISNGIPSVTSGFPSIVISIALSVLVIQATPSYYNSVINWIASSVFASYLVTSNVLFKYQFWKISTSLLSLHSKIIEGIIITIIVILITVLVDKIYLLLFNGLIKNRLNSFAKRMTHKLGWTE